MKDETESDLKGEQTSGESSSKNSKGEPMVSEELVKRQIIAASLPLVHEHGWSWQTIAAGAESIGYPSVAHGMFPRGGVDLVHHFNVSCNRKLVAHFKSQPKDRRQYSLTKNIEIALEMRLRLLIPYIDTWPKAMALLALPSNIPQGTKNLCILVDDILFYSGDRTANFDWYTKRLAVASIYLMTELAMIQDKSEDFRDTWAFMSRRLQEMDNVQNFTNGIPKFVSGVATTFQNMLGFGAFRR